MAAPGCVSILQPIWGKKAIEAKKQRAYEVKMEKRKEFIRRQGRIAARMIKEKQDRIAKKKTTSKSSKGIGLGIMFLPQHAASNATTAEEEKEACRRILNIIRYGCIFSSELWSLETNEELGKNWEMAGV